MVRVIWLIVLAAFFSPSLWAAPEKGDAPAKTGKPVVEEGVASRASLLAAAKEIDRLIEANYSKHKVQPNAMTDDEDFLRRAYLDIAGRIPTYEEARAFLESKSVGKRLDLIDKLADSEAYVSHTYNFWADLLRVKTRLTNQVNGRPYMEWIKQAVRENMPYDQLVYEMLTADGRVTDDGAAGFFIRDSGMPLDAMANTVRIFLGTRIGCAQCHDHPFDKWTQHEFYEMAAYTFGVNTRQRPAGMENPRRLAQQYELTDREQQILQRLLRSQSFAVSDTNKKLRLPADYKYKDAKPGDAVQPSVIFGKQPTVASSQPPRDAFAAWITSTETPRFAEVIANRLWKRAMGVGLVEPVDDFTDDTEASNPELLAFLAAKIKELNFDTRAFNRLVCYTKTYQRESVRRELRLDQPFHFPGPALRRMTSEQLWDSVMTLIVPGIDERKGPAIYPELSMEKDVSEMKGEELVQAVKELAARGRGDAMDRKRMVDRVLGNGAGRDRQFPPTYVRASESPQAPAQPGSFLQEFGSSDRELIDSANADPTVTQALEMLNGSMSNSVLNGRSLLSETVQKTSGTDEQLRVIFMSILSRNPTATDLEIARGELRADPRNGLRNVAWALLNTREFLFVK